MILEIRIGVYTVDVFDVITPYTNLRVIKLLFLDVKKQRK